MTDLGWPEFQSLARNVAGELGARRAETWTVAAWHENPLRPAATLDGPGSAQLFIHYGAGGADKITVTGLLPQGTYAGRGFTASVDPARGARAIAQAADTRVLRAGYLDILPGKVAQKQADDAMRADRGAAAAQAAALFEIPAPEDGKPWQPTPGEPLIAAQLAGLAEAATRRLRELAASGPLAAEDAILVAVSLKAALDHIGETLSSAAVTDALPDAAEHLDIAAARAMGAAHLIYLAEPAMRAARPAPGRPLDFPDDVKPAAPTQRGAAATPPGGMSPQTLTRATGLGRPR